MHQTEHEQVRAVLRSFLLAEMESSRGVSGRGRMGCRAVQLWIRCLLRIRWIGGVGAGRVSLTDG